MTANVAAYHANMTEKAMQEALLSAARRHHWHCYHTYDSQRSAMGFPDLICIRGSQQIALELKSQRGRVMPWQQSWIDRFSGVLGCTAAIVRPNPKPGEISFDKALELLGGCER